MNKTSKFRFDARDIPPQAVQEPIPPGWYVVAVVEGKLEPTQAGDGTRAILTLQVLEGDYVGQRVTYGINFDLQGKPEATDIGRRQLSSVCHATGTLVLDDLNNLRGKPFLAKVAVDPAREQYEARNIVKATKPVEGAAGSPGTSAAPPPAWATDPNDPAGADMAEVQQAVAESIPRFVNVKFQRPPATTWYVALRDVDEEPVLAEASAIKDWIEKGDLDPTTAEICLEGDDSWQSFAAAGWTWTDLTEAPAPAPPKAPARRAPAPAPAKAPAPAPAKAPAPAPAKAPAPAPAKAPAPAPAKTSATSGKPPWA